jgi:uncharacterized membrane protein YqhA
VTNQSPPEARRQSQSLGARLLASSRYVITVAALGTFMAGTVLLVFGALSVIEISIEAFGEFNLSAHAVEELAVEFIKLTDVFLLGTVLYIVALGLFQLFVDSTLPLPSWLIVKDLEHLKEKLVGVIVVLLGVSFLGEVVSWDGQTDILRLGISVALVIAALSIVLKTMTSSSHGTPHPPAPHVASPAVAVTEPPPASVAPATNPGSSHPDQGRSSA